MKATYVNSYPSAKGNSVFNYSVTGTSDEMAAFKAAKQANGKDYYREYPDGTARWASTIFVGDTCDIEVTPKGNILADRSAMRKAISLTKQMGGDLGQAFANEAAKGLVVSLFGSRSTAPKAPVRVPETPAAPAKEEVPHNEELDETN